MRSLINRIIAFKARLAIALLVVGAVLLWPGHNSTFRWLGGAVSPALRMQLPYEPSTLDFSLAEDGVSFRVLSALMMVAPLTAVSTLVTDDNISEDARRAVAEAGVSLVTVPSEGGA